jgi:hypothetical protein
MRDSGIVDLSGEFLATVCRATPGTAFAAAWLAYEDRHRELYEAFYYRSPEAWSDRRRLAHELALRRDEMCGHVRSFLVAAPGTIDALRGRVAELIGARPRARIFFSVALQWTDGRADSLRGQEVLAARAAAEVLRLLRSPNAGPELRRFFEGGYADECYPPKMGYYLGARIFREIAAKDGARSAISIAPSVFLERAEPILTGISQQTRSALAPRVDLPAIVELRDRFLERARRAGVAMPFTPEMREWTRPSMISWRQEARAVAIPRWDELGEPQRRLLELMAGARGSQQLFELLFRWFLVPHELTHALQENAAAAAHPGHAAGERLANDAAVAFLAEDPEARRSLFALAPLLVGARQRLPRLPVEGDEAALDRHVDAHYDELGRDLPLYGAFQVRLILDSLRRLDALRFEEVVQRTVLAPRESR